MARKVTKWVDVNTAEELHRALADVNSTPFGNVGQNVGYRVTEKARRDMPNWDFDDRLNVKYMTEHPNHRIDPGCVTRADVNAPSIKAITGKTWHDGKLVEIPLYGHDMELDQHPARPRVSVVAAVVMLIGIALPVYWVMNATPVGNGAFCGAPVVLLLTAGALQGVSQIGWQK